MKTKMVLALCLLLVAFVGPAAAQDADGHAAFSPAPAVSALSEGEVARIKAALDGKNPDEIKALLPSLLPGDVVVTNSLGQASTDLVYVPITPCRVIDTRIGAKIAAAETRNYHIVGSTDYSAYGGNAAGCGIPAGNVIDPVDSSLAVILSYTQKVRALALNVVAVFPDGEGWLSAWPTNRAQPTASILNYAKVTGLNIANGLMVTSCDAYDMLPPYSPCPNGDISIRADLSATHIVVDVAGYFVPATGYGQRASNANASSVNLSDGACHTLTSAALTNNSSYTRTVVCIATASAEISHTNGTVDQLNLKIATDATTCASPQAAAGEANWEIPSVLPTAGGVDNTVTLMTTHELAAGAAATYYLNANMYSGAGTGDTIPDSNVTCFIP